MSLPGFEPLTLDKRYLCKIRKKTPPPPRFEPGTIGMSVERANHQTIKSGTVKSHVKYQMKVFYQFVSFHDCEMIFKKIAFKPSKLFPQATIRRLDQHTKMHFFIVHLGMLVQPANCGLREELESLESRFTMQKQRKS